MPNTVFVGETGYGMTPCPQEAYPQEAKFFVWKEVGSEQGTKQEWLLWGLNHCLSPGGSSPNPCCLNSNSSCCWSEESQAGKTPLPLPFCPASCFPVVSIIPLSQPPTPTSAPGDERAHYTSGCSIHLPVVVVKIETCKRQKKGGMKFTEGQREAII